MSDGGYRRLIDPMARVAGYTARRAGFFDQRAVAQRIDRLERKQVAVVDATAAAAPASGFTPTSDLMIYGLLGTPTTGSSVDTVNYVTAMSTIITIPGAEVHDLLVTGWLICSHSVATGTVVVKATAGAASGSGLSVITGTAKLTVPVAYKINSATGATTCSIQYRPGVAGTASAFAVMMEVRTQRTA